MNESEQFTFLPSWESEILFMLDGSEGLVISSNLLNISSLQFSKRFCWISGLTTGPVVVQFKRLHTISIVLTPIAIKALFNIPAFALNNKAVEALDIGSDLGVDETALNSFPDFLSRARYLENKILHAVNESNELWKALSIASLVTKLAKSNYTSSSADIETLLGYSRTQSFRLFNDWFGLSINRFQKLMRFRETIDALHARHRPLTQLSYELGYFDQSHFIRSFKSYTGISPKQYLRLKPELPGILSMEQPYNY